MASKCYTNFMSGNHETPTNLDNKLKLGLVLNTSFTVFEFIVGIFSGSLALISDAAHNLTDSLSIIIAFFANKLAGRQATIDKTYGYGRATVLAALLNTFILFALAIYIFYEAYKRILNPEPLEGGIIMIVAFIGILVNGSVAAMFYKNKDDLNMKGTFLNMFYDMLASAGAVAAGGVILLTNWTLIDPLISVLIALMQLKSGWEVVRSALHVLLDGVPEGVDIQKVKKAVLSTPGVSGMDDLHVWALSTTEAALSAHIVIKKCSLEESITLSQKIKNSLHEKFNITHATLETELTEGPHDNERTDEGM